MATPLDLAALQQFEGVFPFLFILVLTYAVLSSTDYFKKRVGFAAIIAFLLAFMTLLSPIAIKSVALMAPWFVLFFIFITLLMLTFMATGVKMDRIVKFVQDGEFAVGLWMMSIVLVIFIGSALAVWNAETGGPAALLDEDGSGNLDLDFKQGEWNFFQTVFHPNFLGLALVMLLAMFTVKYMTSSE